MKATELFLNKIRGYARQEWRTYAIALALASSYTLQDEFTPLVLNRDPSTPIDAEAIAHILITAGASGVLYGLIGIHLAFFVFEYFYYPVKMLRREIFLRDEAFVASFSLVVGLTVVLVSDLLVYLYP